MATQPIPLWLDCDTGHDDAFALLLSAQHPSLRLLGVSTVYGNAHLAHTTRNTRSILTAINREDVPVYPGASRPFCREPASAPDIHGESGLDGTTCLPEPRVPARTDLPAVEAMFRALSAEPPRTAWLVATGCLTNVALLFAVHPELAAHIAGLSIMGGAIGGGFSEAPMGMLGGTAEGEHGERFGNWTPWAEFNIYIDPESASAVFSNPVLAAKTTLAPLDLTHQFLATGAVQTAVLRGYDPPPSEGNVSTEGTSQVRKLFYEILMFFAQTYADVFGLTDGPPTHDPLAVAAILVPEFFDDANGERYSVQVVTDGEQGTSSKARNGASQCGRTVATLLSPEQQGVRIPRTLQVDKIWEILEACLGRVEKSFRVKP